MTWRVLARTSVLLVLLVCALGGVGRPALVTTQAAAQGTPAAPIETIEPTETAEVGETEGEGTGAVGQPPPPVDTDDPTAVELEDWMALVAVALLLGVAGVALWRLFDYLRDSRKDYYQTVREFARKGVFFTPLMVGPTTPAAARGVAADPEAIDTTVSFEVVGPGVIAPGRAADFFALRNGSAAPAATWTIEQPTSAGASAATATASPGTGERTSVTASTPGAFILAASLPGTPALTVRTLVTVTEPPASGEELPPLPFIGQGFGSIVGAIVLIAALVVLAATRAIDADVVGVILGTLAGYLFGVVVAQART